MNTWAVVFYAWAGLVLFSIIVGAESSDPKKQTNRAVVLFVSAIWPVVLVVAVVRKLTGR